MSAGAICSLVLSIFSLIVVPASNAHMDKQGAPVPTEAQREVLRNEYGAVIKDDQGQKINYTREELEAQAVRASAPAVKPVANSGATSPGTRPVWNYAAFGSGIGKSNIAVAPNGRMVEMYMGGSSTIFGDDDYWYALRYQKTEGSKGEYSQVFVSTHLPSGISRIKVANILGDSMKEILVATRDGLVHVYDQQTKRRLGTVKTTARDLTGMDVADLDGDELDEIVVCTRDDLYVYSGNGSLLWQVPGIGGLDLVVGQMDSDAALEIAVTDGHVVDSLTQAVQWTWPDGFGVMLDAADVDKDGKDELIAAESWYEVWAYDVDGQLPKWSFRAGRDLAAIRVVDIDNDGTLELLVGEGQWGNLIAYDTSTLEPEWSIGNPEHGVTDIAAEDVDNDGVEELIWGAGATSTGEDHLYVADWRQKLIEWQNVHLDGPFVGPEVGDLDGDGTEEIVVASFESDSGYGSGRILVFDGATFRLRGMSGEVAGGLAYTGIHDIKLRDVDRDGRMEILVAADRLYAGVVEIYGFDGSNFVLKASNADRPHGAPFYSVDASDIDHDGKIEVIAGGGRAHTGAQGVFLYVYDYPSMNSEWHSMQMGDYWDNIKGLSIGDTDLDGNKELIGMVNGGQTYIFDGATKELEAILPGRSTALYEREQQFPLIALGDNNGTIRVYKHQTEGYAQTRELNLVSSRVHGLRFNPRRWGGGVWISTRGRLQLISLSGETLWQSFRYGHFGERMARLASTPIGVSAGLYNVAAFRVGPWATAEGQ